MAPGSLSFGTKFASVPLGGAPALSRRGALADDRNPRHHSRYRSAVTPARWPAQSASADAPRGWAVRALGSVPGGLSRGALGYPAGLQLSDAPDGSAALPLTLAHYAHFFGTPLYAHVLFTTLRISLATTLAAALLGYPVALVMARANPMLSRAVTLIIIAPLVVSVVVRTYGWQLILANGPQGLLNWMLLSLGVIRTPVRLLYSETAVVLGSLHVFLPMMVLPLAAALGKIDPRLDDAARMLGAGALRIFWRITLPLSLPGLAVGCGLVFSLTAGSYVTPAILGGPAGQMLGNLIEQQIMAVYDWPFGAAIATVLVVIVLAANLVSMRLIERRRPVGDPT
jgi:putative spermidine/putrescine transport system permease protein